MVVINPEILMTSDHVEAMWRKPKVTSRLLSIIFDEAHCISQWGSFRSEYLHVGALRQSIPDRVPFYIPSATLPPLVLRDIVEILSLRPENTEYILCSNDRPEIRLAVRGMVFPANSFQDLAFLIPEGFKEGDPPPAKFLVFFSDRKITEAAARYLQSRLPGSLVDKIKWFHAINTPEYRVEEVDNLRDGNTMGYCCTDSFGVVCYIISSNVIEAHQLAGDRSSGHPDCGPV